MKLTLLISYLSFSVSYKIQPQSSFRPPRQGVPATTSHIEDKSAKIASSNDLDPKKDRVKPPAPELKSRDSPTTSKYDLGLRKNPPVANAVTISSTNTSEEAQNKGSRGSQTREQNAVVFLVEHNSTRDFPNPNTETKMEECPPSKRKRSLPRLNHRRRLKDALPIIENGAVVASPNTSTSSK